MAIEVKKAKDYVRNRGLKALIIGSSGIGKAQPNNEKVLTVDGWKKVKHLKIGDKLFSSNGDIQEIQNIFEQGFLDIYEINFDDGTSVQCCEDHLWKIYARTGHYDRERVVTTRRIIDMLNNGETVGIPVMKPIKREHKNFKIDPYVIGVLIGDGYIPQKGYIQISSDEIDIIEKVKMRLGEDYEIKKNSEKNYTWTIHVSDRYREKNGLKIGSKGFWHQVGIKEELRRLGLEGKKSHNKFIPKEYLEGSIEQRLELLRGLMDTDGSISNRKNEPNKRSHVMFTTTSEKLKNDFLRLCRELGYVVTVNKENRTDYTSGVCYNFTVRVTDEDYLPFSSKKHISRYKNPKISKSYNKRKFIKSIKKLNKKTKMRCIQVSSKDRLYITSGHNLTHNSSLSLTTGKTIVISAEGGDLVLADSDVDIIRVKSLIELREAFEYVKEHTDDYDTVVIDSITEVMEMIVEELKGMPEYQGMNKSMPMWMAFTEIGTKIAKSFRDLDGINVILLALPENIKVGLKDKILPMIPAKKLQAKLQSLYDIVCLIDVDEEGNRWFIFDSTEEFDGKDRTGKLPKKMKYEKGVGFKPVLEIVDGS